MKKLSAWESGRDVVTKNMALVNLLRALAIIISGIANAIT
jgi:hypothetical protein